MARKIASIALLLLLSGVGHADNDQEDGDKHVSGMSIVGNDEAPKSLVIVPWKSSGLGDTLDVYQQMDDGRQPVDREVFERSLDYYEIRTGKK